MFDEITDVPFKLIVSIILFILAMSSDVNLFPSMIIHSSTALLAHLNVNCAVQYMASFI